MGFGGDTGMKKRKSEKEKTRNNKEREGKNRRGERWKNITL